MTGGLSEQDIFQLLEDAEQRLGGVSSGRKSQRPGTSAVDDIQKTISAKVSGSQSVDTARNSVQLRQVVPKKEAKTTKVRV